MKPVAAGSSDLLIRSLCQTFRSDHRFHRQCQCSGMSSGICLRRASIKSRKPFANSIELRGIAHALLICTVIDDFPRNV